MYLAHLTDADLRSYATYHMTLDEANKAYDHLHGCADCSHRYAQIAATVVNPNPAPEPIEQPVA